MPIGWEIALSLNSQSLKPDKGMNFAPFGRRTGLWSAGYANVSAVPLVPRAADALGKKTGL